MFITILQKQQRNHLDEWRHHLNEVIGGKK